MIFRNIDFSLIHGSDNRTPFIRTMGCGSFKEAMTSFFVSCPIPCNVHNALIRSRSSTAVAAISSSCETTSVVDSVDSTSSRCAISRTFPLECCMYGTNSVCVNTDRFGISLACFLSGTTRQILPRPSGFSKPRALICFLKNEVTNMRCWTIPLYMSTIYNATSGQLIRFTGRNLSSVDARNSSCS